METRKYRYNQRAGALQEAMGADMNNYVEAHNTGVNMPALSRTSLVQAQGMGGQAPEPASDSGLDPQRRGLRYSFFFATVEEGQRALMIEQDGAMEVIEGPRRVWSRKRRFEAMAHYVAHPGEFLVLRYRDGKQEHLAGPAHCWFDPRKHRSVMKEESLQISAKEAVVVYSEQDGAVARRIAHGPATFVPEPGEWLHTFSWHGSIGGHKVPNALVFQKLWLMPDQMYHDVNEVRTADDAVLTIKLMLFFELIDIERMLATSHDPIGDFVNAATSDTVEFLSRHDFESFKKNAAKLNDLGTYKQLSARAEQCGYRIGKVVYRGYGAPPALQKMHDEAIQARTRLQFERQTEQQAQELSDFKLERQLTRAAKERSERTLDFDQKLALERLQQDAALATEAARRASERELADLDAQRTEALEAARDARQRAHLEALGALGVDLTALLTQGRADKVIEVRGASTPHVHLDR